ncbi:MAG: hypothetical protein EOO46_02765 [Flavobacterium sp.]|nr:MAG: hypothetical protein EOO46_02765 [Flavobacterium sp.]
MVPSFEIEHIDSSWLVNITSYNKLKKSLFFYELFKEYEFVLTYELDAWVFRDELLFWCNKGYDYIGAPWFKGWAQGGNPEVIGVGNSGFSLRNTAKSITCIERIEKLRRVRSFWFSSKLQALWRFNNMIIFFGSMLKLRSGKYLDDLLLGDIHNEDHYWGEYVSHTFSDYKVASIDDAIRFSFEVNPSILYNINNCQLPFGCHGWEKYDQEFWANFIEVK